MPPHFVRLHLGWRTFTPAYVNMDGIRIIKSTYEPDAAGAMLLRDGEEESENAIFTRETPEEVVLLAHGLPVDFHVAREPKPELDMTPRSPGTPKKAPKRTHVAAKRLVNATKQRRKK